MCPCMTTLKSSICVTSTEEWGIAGIFRYAQFPVQRPLLKTELPTTMVGHLSKFGFFSGIVCVGGKDLVKYCTRRINVYDAGLTTCYINIISQW